MEQILTFSAAGDNINVESGLIRGVSLITEGAVLGHNCFADNKTNKTVLEACQKAARVKVKQNHGTDVSSIVGYLENFRIEGDQVKADLQLLKSCDQFNYILELAQKLTNHFGLSIAFEPSFETINKKEFVRCNKIYSADIVDSPAANPNGLFSMKKDKKDEVKVEDTDNSENVDKAEEKDEAQDEQDDEAEDEQDGGKDEDKEKIEQYVADMAGMKAQLSAISDRLELMVGVVDALNNKVDAVKAEFSTKLEGYKAEFTSKVELSSKLADQAKELEAKMANADILACRKLGRTGVPMNMIPSADVASGYTAAEQLNLIRNPVERAEFFSKNKAEIYKEYQATVNRRLTSQN